LIIAAIPAYNQEDTIAKVIVQAQKFVDRVIVCDDGSTDMTATIAERLGAEVIRHKRNEGYGKAIQSLFERAGPLDAEVLVTIDGDGQHDPNQIPMLLDSMAKESADIVIGSRFLGKNKPADMPRYRIFGIRAISRLAAKTSGMKVLDAQSGFRAYSKKALQRIKLAEYGMGVSTEILMKAKEENLKVVEVPARITYDSGKTSKHNPVYQALDVIASILKFMSLRHPLLFYGIPGAVAFLGGISLGMLAIQQYSIEGRLVTNVALLSIAGVLTGLLAIFTAIILFTVIHVIREGGMR